jgi:hypothetical protein
VIPTSPARTEITQAHSVNTYMYVNWEVTFTPFLRCDDKAVIAFHCLVLPEHKANICECQRTD